MPRLTRSLCSASRICNEPPDDGTARRILPPLGFIPTEWYPSALAIAGNDLLIATAKGESSGPNNMQGTLKGERKRKEHPYIPTLIGGSIQRISLADIDKNLAAYTRQVEEDNLAALRRRQSSNSPAERIPSATLFMC